ncbi:MAG TPA: exodeoxyribonuclease III [Verrucomicrobiae bacterium]|nr:exodeoxyribonuclease III [Verrucomicrobiae bacterium]
MKFISWNVNGLRSVMGKGFLDFVAAADPDVLCLQETRAEPGEVELLLPQYPFVYWNVPVGRKGYSGTAIFSKLEPRAVRMGMGKSEHDAEGRLITAEFDGYYLCNVYTPNSQRGLTRLAYRERWDSDFLAFLKRLSRAKSVVLCGDLNVAHREIDLANPRSNVRNAGFTAEERAGFDRILGGGFLDTFREFCSEGGRYSWWSYMNRARERNIGWRIDYWVISAALRPRLKDAFILPEVMGSDHCPVGILLARDPSP